MCKHRRALLTRQLSWGAQLYYWPGMKNCIKTYLSKCATCQKFSASQARIPVNGTAPSAAEFPMNNLGMDLFDVARKKWLAVVCQFSGYAWLSPQENDYSIHSANLGQLIHRIWISIQNKVRWRTSNLFGIR